MAAHAAIETGVTVGRWSDSVTCSLSSPGEWFAQPLMADVKEFGHRVRVLTEVIEDEDEIALVTSAFQSKGWTVRSARDGEARGYPARNRTWLVIEVRFNGYRRTAAKVAVRRIDEVAEKLCLGIWARYAEVISFPRELEKTYYIEEKPAPWLASRRLLSHAARLTRIPRPTGLIRLPGNARESDARSQLARFDLGRPFDPSRDAVRPAIPDSPEKADRTVTPEPASPAVMAAVAAVLLAVVCGAVAVWASGAWKAVPLVFGVVLTVPATLAVPADQRLARRAGLGFALVCGFVLLGVIGGLAVPGHKPSAFLGLAVLAVVVLIIGRGVMLALRESGLTGQLWWLLPLAVTVLVPVVLALGGTFDAEYLSYGFGIPADTISVPTISRLAIAGSSMLIGLVVVVILVAILGWVRYFHGFDAITRPLLVLGTIAVASTYLLASVTSGFSHADGAARSAAARARSGRQPVAYFGLQGTLDCVRPVSPSVPVYDGPLPVGRPVLSFGTTGTQLWLWDPESSRAISVPLQDIIAIPATGTPARC
jgi:hypothetical protein